MLPADLCIDGDFPIFHSEELTGVEQELSSPLGTHFGNPKMDEKGAAVRKWPEVRAHYTETSQTRSAILERVRSSCLTQT
jgi:hypothetical protein